MEAEHLPPPKKSWADVLATLPEDLQHELTESLTEKTLQSLNRDAFLNLRREQLEPPGDWWEVWLVMAGRGFGKTHAGGNWLAEQHISYGADVTGIIAATSTDLRRYCIEGQSGILNTSPAHFRPRYEPSKTRLVWPNNTITHLFTSEEPERLRGPNLAAAWGDEVGSWAKPDMTMDMLNLCLRSGANPRSMFTTTPRPIPVIRDLVAREGQDVVVTRGGTTENTQHLSMRFLKNMVKQYKGTRLERQELHGELLNDFEGSLWNHAMLEEALLTEKRNNFYKELTQVYVGVDPATTANGTTGIIPVGKNERGHGFVLADHSISGTPEEWGRKAIGAYYSYNANALVCEVNQGGDMVKSVIRNIDPLVPIIEVRASQGKVARAEPISLLYEQKRMWHCGVFRDLEEEMCAMVPGELKKSPDRVDALVWAAWEHFVSNAGSTAGTWGR